MSIPTPTNLRGKELLLHIMKLVEAEYASGPAVDDIYGNKAGHWDQHTWMDVNPDAYNDDSSIDCASQMTQDNCIDNNNPAYLHHPELKALYRITLPYIPTNSCGTAGCFAGHTVAAVGDSASVYMFGDEVDSDGHINLGGSKLKINRVIPVEGGPELEVPTRARKLLGLTVDQAEELFSSRNSIHQLRALVDRFSSEM